MVTNCINEELEFDSEESLKDYFKQFAMHIKKGDIIALRGTLGAGKTTIAREIIQTICGEDTIVQSPTFNLLQVYDTPKFSIYHFDLYRLEDENEAFELGIDEAFTHHVSIIEWPELFEPFLPKNTINVYITVNNNDNRICKIITNQ